MSVFIGLPTKPNKSPVAAIAKASGLLEKPDPGNYIWVFQNKTLRIMLEDMRESLKIDRDWCDEVGWIHGWAICISISSNRDEVAYQNWISLISLIASNNGASFLFFDEGTGDPTTKHRVTNFTGIKAIHSEDGSEVVSESPTPAPEPEPEPEPARRRAASTQEAPQNDSGTDLAEMIRRELAKNGLISPQEKKAMKELEAAASEDEEEPTLRLMEYDEEEEEESEEAYDDWDFE